MKDIQRKANRYFTDIEKKEIIHISNVLNVYRALRYKSIKELSKYLNISYTLMTNYINAKNIIPQHRLIKLILYLEIPLNEFIELQNH